MHDALSDYGVVFGVPLTEQEFVQRVGHSDWLRKYDDPSASAAAREAKRWARWKEQYCPLIARPYSELAHLAGRHGAEVRCGATLHDIRDATAKKSTVIVLSHWKGWEISNDDFLPSGSDGEFAERVSRCDSQLAQWILDRFEIIGISAVQPGMKAAFRRLVRRIRRHPKNLRAVLRAAVNANLPIDGTVNSGADRVLVHPVTEYSRRRDQLDVIFEGLLAPGNRLELFDGLHDKHTVEAALAAEFRGVLDLTTCTSTVLADFIDSRRGHAIRTVNFTSALEPIAAAGCVHRALELVLKDGMKYLDARELAYHGLLTQLRELRECIKAKGIWRV